MSKYSVHSYDPEDGSFKSREEIDKEIAEIESEIERIKNSKPRKVATVIAWTLLFTIALPVLMLFLITGKPVKMNWYD